MVWLAEQACLEVGCSPPAKSRSGQRARPRRSMCNGQREIDPIITLCPEALTMALVHVHAFEKLMAVTKG